MFVKFTGRDVACKTNALRLGALECSWGLWFNTVCGFRANSDKSNTQGQSQRVNESKWERVREAQSYEKD